MLCVHPDLICLLIIISQRGAELARGTTFGSQNQSEGTNFGGEPKFLLQSNV